ncbi:hypothetical protein BN946_scf184840.g17 [Trametes cinnabarina]|uniref:Uncharacterized protein n=1 Tax=Pycnoporus cinnabarinus TaxID=5643 RepID=A0A060STS1_PYCCI|nr:hypothetical protein BN946_scf184840.g17 [Trametes cinnabarina]
MDFQTIHGNHLYIQPAPLPTPLGHTPEAVDVMFPALPALMYNTPANLDQLAQGQVQGPANPAPAAPADENQENVPPPASQPQASNPRRVRDLRRRARELREQRSAPFVRSQMRYRRVLGDLNGQQVKDTRRVTVNDIDGRAGAAAVPSELPHNDYLDLNRPLQDILADPATSVGSWEAHEEE